MTMIVLVRSRSSGNLFSEVTINSTSTRQRLKLKGHIITLGKPLRYIIDVIKSLGGSLVDDMHLVDELPLRPPNGYTDAQCAI